MVLHNIENAAPASGDLRGREWSLKDRQGSLPQRRPNDPARKRLNEATLLEFVEKDDEVVFYGGTIEGGSKSTPIACAKALAWGFTRVNYFAGGLNAWNKAGYPVETSQ